MNNKTTFLIVQVFIFLLLPQTILCAVETPETVLDKFNAGVTPDEVKQYLTGTMKTQFEGLDKESQEAFIKHNKMKTYKAKIIPVRNDLQFVFVTYLEYADRLGRGSPEYPIIYEFHKAGNQWKISSRMSGHIIIDLFKENYSVDQFHTKNIFQFEGKRIQMESAFAYFKKTSRRLNENTETTVSIRFYPFKFQERDLEYFKYNFDWIVEETDKASAITSSLKYPIGELCLYLDEQNKIVSFCVNGYYFNDQFGSFNYCLQENLFKQFNLSENNINLQIKGDFKSPTDKNIGCDINIALPIFKEGID